MSTPDPLLVDLLRGQPVRGGEQLVQSAIEHRLGGQLLSAVWSGRAELESTAERLLTATDLSNAAHQTRLWSTLLAVQATLASEGLAVAALKGVTSEARWYSRPGERPCTDVDLWLAPGDIDRIDRVLDLLAPGYPSREEATALARARRLQHVHFDLNGITIDLHLDPLKLGVWTRQLDEVWRSTTTIVAPDGTDVRVLSPEIALVGALTHLNKDDFAKLGAYAEIARIATTPELDWDETARFVHGEGLEICAWKSLAAVAQVVDAPVPVLPPPGWRSRTWERIWPADQRLLGASHPRALKRQVLMPLLMPGRERDALREGVRVMIPPRALLDVHVPELSSHGTLRRFTWDRLSRHHERRRTEPATCRDARTR